MALSPHISNALREVQRAMVDLEHMLGGLPGTLMPSVFNRTGSRCPTTDMVETKDSYELQAEDIQVEVPDSHTIVLKGTMQQEHKMEPPTSTSSDEQKGAEDTSDTQRVTETATDKEKQAIEASDNCQWWVQERVSGSFFRSFHLPINIDPQSIKASYVNGVLKVTIPKAESKKSTSIDID
ncbi:HSP20-like chaperone [Mucor lusitanicus]